MLRKPNIVGTLLIAIVALLISSPHMANVGAQEDTPTTEDTTLTTATAQQSAFVIICDSKPNQIIVLDSTGEWLPTVRQAYIAIEIGKPSTIVCSMWSGQFKPTNIASKTWSLSQIKTVSVTQFQIYIDKLQIDPLAIAKENAGDTGTPPDSSKE